MNLKNGKVFKSKFVGTWSFSYEIRIYRAAVTQKLRNTDLDRILVKSRRCSLLTLSSFYLILRPQYTLRIYSLKFQTSNQIIEAGHFFCLTTA